MRRKLKRFQENAERGNVIEPGKDSYQSIKGYWQEHYFHNEHDIILELGCGNFVRYDHITLQFLPSLVA